ncbi:hypothetical protein BDP27DRAFT_1444480 [Rhodocollybia butyracea]|uniref:Uncharacterized protein n=1 Tax=Rhodocollybia butyracea TaxID=206335 RepID=A0A9P5Q540_9AGAR|nr:hypothetical protein BDP27DRAFT_1444480 [Rhodocollybia butyracea]
MNHPNKATAAFIADNRERAKLDDRIQRVAFPVPFNDPRVRGYPSVRVQTYCNSSGVSIDYIHALPQEQDEDDELETGNDDHYDPDEPSIAKFIADRKRWLAEPAASMAKLADRIGEFPIPFNDPRVQKYITQSDIPTEYLDYAPHDQVRSGQDGIHSAKAWLLGWLVLAEMFYCHNTHYPPTFPGIVEIALVLLPQAERFASVVKSTVYAALKSHAYIIVPCLDSLKQIHQYFKKVRDAKLARNVNEKEVSRWWPQLRSGELQDSYFKDGSLYRYHVVPHAGTKPGVWIEVAPFDKPDFYSHLSPFAAVLNAFRSLCIWKEARIGSASRKSSPTLYAALREAQIPESDLFQFETMHNTRWKPSSGSSDMLQKYGFDSGLDFSGGDPSGGDAKGV